MVGIEQVDWVLGAVLVVLLVRHGLRSLCSLSLPTETAEYVMFAPYVEVSRAEDYVKAQEVHRPDCVLYFRQLAWMLSAADQSVSVCVEAHRDVKAGGSREKDSV